ncbi:MAG: hypothetical protein BRD55_11135 [Bacteroidetes bacterium SW_9_63_38]|nr:MAG: hypothetical protein BRD55_11135 [Bacteroidetes bacterium SW_9_63_38]
MADPEQDTATDAEFPDESSTLARERLDLTVRSMALVAHYVGGIDGTFDADEHEEAADPLVLNANLHSLLYDGNPDDDASIQAVADRLSDDTLRAELEDAIKAVDGTLSNEALMDRMKALSAQAEELNGYLPLEEIRGRTDDEYRRAIREHVERYELDVEVDAYDDVEALYDAFDDALDDEATGEPFRMNLAYALVHYGTYIGYASGRLFSSSPYSSQEEEAVTDVGIVYGLPAFDLMTAKMQAEMGADAMEAITSTSFMEELRETVGL